MAIIRHGQIQDEARAHDRIAQLVNEVNGLLAQLKSGSISLARAKAQAAIYRQNYVDWINAGNVTTRSVKLAMMNQYDPSRCEYICGVDRIIGSFDNYAGVTPSTIAPPGNNPGYASPEGMYNTATAGNIPILVPEDFAGIVDDASAATQTGAGSSFVDFFTQEIGPLPIWAWLALGGVGYAVVKGK